MSYCAKLLGLGRASYNRGCCCCWGEIDKDKPAACTTVSGGSLFLSSISQHCLQARCTCDCSVLGWQMLAQKAIFSLHRPADAVPSWHMSRKADKVCCELMPPRPWKEQILHFSAGQQCPAVLKWVTSIFPNAEKIPLGVDRPVPGARAKFSKARGLVMSWSYPGDIQNDPLTGPTLPIPGLEVRGAHSG